MASFARGNLGAAKKFITNLRLWITCEFINSTGSAKGIVAHTATSLLKEHGGELELKSHGPSLFYHNMGT